jgi:hypothetical protein
VDFTFLTYPQSHLSDIPCEFGLSSPTLKAIWLILPPGRSKNCGFGLSSSTLEAIELIFLLVVQRNRDISYLKHILHQI